MGHVWNMIRHIIKWVRLERARPSYRLLQSLCTSLLWLIFILLHEDCENSSGAERGKYLTK